MWQRAARAAAYSLPTSAYGRFFFVTVGGATLGGLTGISTAGNGNIELTAAANKITTSESVAANGSGNVLLSATRCGDRHLQSTRAGQPGYLDDHANLDAGAGRNV